jgi:hypothetical protein
MYKPCKYKQKTKFFHVTKQLLPRGGNTGNKPPYVVGVCYLLPVTDAAGGVR